MHYAVTSGGLEPSAGGAPATPLPGGWLLTGSEISIDLPVDPITFFRHGWHSFSPSGWSAVATEPVSVTDHRIALLHVDHARRGADHHSGSGVACVGLADGTTLLLGSLSVDGWVTLEDGLLVGRHEGAGEIWFVAHGEELVVLAAYATELGQRLGARPTGTRGSAWCSWYSYYEDISGPLMDEAISGVEDLSFEIFQTDDGWQRAVGDWEANSRFPSGMAALAERVRHSGMRPGLWLAPFTAHEDSQVFQAHPEWFVRDASGSPEPAFYNWGGWLYGLDLTQEPVREHLQSLFVQLVDWGFDYLKLDFLFAGAIAGDRSGPGGREEIYRDGLRLIRDAVGDEVYLLGCGAPMIPSIGVLDGIRVSGDVGPLWSNDEYERVVGEPGLSARTALRGTLNRYWLRNLIDIDPDVVYFRSRGLALSADQRALLQDLTRLSGRVSISDPPDWLDASEREEIRRFLGETPEVVQTGRYRFTIDGRDVDFSSAAYPDPRSGVNP